MKKVLFPVLALFLTFWLVLPVAAHTEDEPFVTDLIAGQHTDAGNVKVWNNGSSLYVQYVTTGDWVLEETHLAVATTDRSGIPQTKKGNPIPGKFPYKTEHDAVSEYTYEVPLDAEPDTKLYIAAHAVVIQGGIVGDGEETAWGDGHDFPGRNWATYFVYTLPIDLRGD